MRILKPIVGCWMFIYKNIWIGTTLRDHYRNNSLRKSCFCLEWGTVCFWARSSAVERYPDKIEVTGPTPVAPTRRNLPWVSHTVPLQRKEVEMKQGYVFISLDGVDGVGKTIVAKFLAADGTFQYHKSPAGPFAQLRKEVDVHATPLERYCFYRLATQFDSKSVAVACDSISLAEDRSR